MPMDYSRLPLMTLLRGPVLHTPQGLVLVVSSALYILLGVASLGFGDTVTSLDTVKKLWIGCFFMPVILFVLFVRGNSPNFSPSIPRALWGGFLAALPIFVVWLQ